MCLKDSNKGLVELSSVSLVTQGPCRKGSFVVSMWTVQMAIIVINSLCLIRSSCRQIHKAYLLSGNRDTFQLSLKPRMLRRWVVNAVICPLNLIYLFRFVQSSAFLTIYRTLFTHSTEEAKHRWGLCGCGPNWSTSSSYRCFCHSAVRYPWFFG